MFGMAVVSVQSTLALKDRPIVEHCRQVFSIDCVGVYLDQMQLPFIHIIFFFHSTLSYLIGLTCMNIVQIVRAKPSCT